MRPFQQDLIQYGYVLIRRSNQDRDMYTGEGHVKMEGWSDATYKPRDAKDC
jgi:hypothetical protein